MASLREVRLLPTEQKYIVISPVRNEERNIEATIRSVVAQTVRPARWVIVDDGSQDLTPRIVERYAAAHEWLSLLRLEDRGRYDLMSGGEIKAFYKGFRTVQHEDYGFLGKLDGDVSFDETYYEDVLREFDSDPLLGIAGGGCYYLENGRTIHEPAHKLHVRGAARVYRKKCWDDIDGVIDDLGWDAIDCYKARMLGWHTRTFDSIAFVHHVKTWTKGGLMRGRMRAGRMEYLMGSHPLFFVAKALRDVSLRPYVICSLALVYGYTRSLLLREQRVAEPELIRYIRQSQLRRLLRPGR